MLIFPNKSRTYDAAHDRIRFTGYDGMFEIPFFVDIVALSKATTLRGESESDYLEAFDAVRDTIDRVARKAFTRGRKNMYVLTASDFR